MGRRFARPKEALPLNSTNLKPTAELAAVVGEYLKSPLNVAAACQQVMLYRLIRHNRLVFSSPPGVRRSLRRTLARSTKLDEWLATRDLGARLELGGGDIDALVRRPPFRPSKEQLGQIHQRAVELHAAGVLSDSGDPASEAEIEAELIDGVRANSWVSQPRGQAALRRFVGLCSSPAKREQLAALLFRLKQGRDGRPVDLELDGTIRRLQRFFASDPGASNHVVSTPDAAKKFVEAALQAGIPDLKDRAIKDSIRRIERGGVTPPRRKRRSIRL